MPREHTSKVYENELRTLGDKILLMGSLVEEMIAKGTLALRTRDSDLARDTIRLDRRINRLECEVDELSLRILATRQPVASDLRRKWPIRWSSSPALVQRLPRAPTSWWTAGSPSASSTDRWETDGGDD